MDGWELLLGAALEAGMGVLFEAGFGDELRDLKERLTGRSERVHRKAFSQAFDSAAQSVGEAEIQPLLEHQPFREAVISGLLDPMQGFDVRAAADVWGDRLPAHAAALRDFFTALEKELLASETWGPLLMRYKEIRFREDVLTALRERKLEVETKELVTNLNAQLTTIGTIVVGDVIRKYIDKSVTIEQFKLEVVTRPESDPAYLRHRYLTELAAEANHLPWASLDPDYASPDRGESLDLMDVYTALDTTELERVESEDQVRDDLARQSEAQRISVQKMLNDRQQLVLLGDPGSGKSTLVNFLTYVLAQAGRFEKPDAWLGRLERLGTWDLGALLPIRVVLREFAATLKEGTKKGRANLLLSYLRDTLDEWGVAEYWTHLRSLLAEPKQPLFIMLDGLDEVPASQRRVVVETVNDLVSRHPAHRYLVTCRIYAYVGQPHQLRGFHQATLAPFSREQMTHFVEAWYGELTRLGRFTEAQAKARAGQLQAAVARPDLHGLAQRPLLLTVMALLHTFRGQLPDDRVELYRWTVDLLLRRWEERVGDQDGVLDVLNVPGLKMSDLEAGLYQVAFNAHAGQSSHEGTADIAEGDLRCWLASYLGGSFDKAGDFVDYVRERAGLLLRHKPAAYAFPHRTFQEFMAACHLAGLANYPAEAARLLRDDPNRWREVFVLAAGHAARTHRLGQSIAAVNALCPFEVHQVKQPDAAVFRLAEIAAEALLEIGLVGVRREDTGQAVMGRVRTWLVNGLAADELLAAQERAVAGSALAQLGDPRFRSDAWYLPDEPLLGFIEIPGGPFWMGSDKKRDRHAYDDESPRCKVKLPTYYTAHYPVTQAQYWAFVQATGYKSPKAEADFERPYEWQDGRPPSHLLNHPVVLVTWHDALAYCQWLTEQLREWTATPQPLAELLKNQGWVVRLPSEAEWEKAARGTDSRVYPWGKDVDPNRANYDDTGIGSTSAVGCFPGGVSVYECEDMSGNVWEWTSSLWKDYPYDPRDGREDQKAAGHRVLRGGAFNLNVRVARCAYRFRRNPGYIYWYFGFRVVVAPSVAA